MTKHDLSYKLVGPDGEDYRIVTAFVYERDRFPSRPGFWIQAMCRNALFYKFFPPLVR